jgi:hypothetical protein
MLQIVKTVDETANLKAPSVYIKSVELTDTTVGVNYYLYDSEDKETGRPYWSQDVEALNSLKLSLIYSGTSGSTEYTKPLSQIVMGKDLKFEDSWTFQRRREDAFSLTASCGNTHITGTITQEKVYENNNIVKAKIDNKQYNYINKVLDLSLLNAPVAIPSHTDNKNPFISGSLYTSYTTDKKANMCFVFDLEAYLLKYSQNYQILNKYKTFKDYVLANSTFDIQNSKAYRKEIKLSKGKVVKTDSPYEKLDSSINFYRLTDKEAKFLVSFTDLNDKKSDLQYSVKVSLVINDVSEIFFDEYIINRLYIISDIVKSYSNTLDLYSKNKTIASPTDYFFMHDYDALKNYTDREGNTYFMELYKIFADIAVELAECSSIFTNKNVDSLISLYASILHPLTTNKNLLDGLLNFIDTLTAISSRYAKVKNILSTNAVNGSSDDKNIFEYDFNSLSIDYGYDEAYGYEVYVTDSYDSRLLYKNSGLRVYTSADRQTKTLLEASKYFVSPDQLIRNNLNSYSISTIDIGEKTYPLSSVLGSVDVSTLNEAYIYMKAKSEKILKTINRETDQVSYDYDYGKYGSILYQFASDGISFENILNSPNQSINGLNKNILFDLNKDSQQLSLQYITSTNILDIYLAFDSNMIANIPKNDTSILQFVAAWNVQNRANVRFPINDAALTNLSLKTKIIFYYNQIFKEIAIATGTNYILYGLEEVNGNTNKIYTGFRHFNQYYILQKNQEALSSNFVRRQPVTEDMLLNVNPEFLNRTTGDSQNNLTIEDI